MHCKNRWLKVQYVRVSVSNTQWSIARCWPRWRVHCMSAGHPTSLWWLVCEGPCRPSFQVCVILSWWRCAVVFFTVLPVWAIFKMDERPEERTLCLFLLQICASLQHFWGYLRISLTHLFLFTSETVSPTGLLHHVLMENTVRGAGRTMNVKKRFMVLSELFAVLKQQDAVRIQQVSVILLFGFRIMHRRCAENVNFYKMVKC